MTHGGEPPAGAPVRYDRQLIVALLGGPDDAATLGQADALDRKKREPPLPSEVVAIRGPPDVDELRSALAGRRRVSLPVTRQSRVYILGACDAAARTFAGHTPAALAALLAGAGLRELAMISIIGDGAGRDVDRADEAQTDAQATSFASLLHRALRDDHGVFTTVHARVGAVRVLTQPMRSGANVVDVGRKVTSPRPDDAADRHHAPRSKLRIRWDRDRQVREWSN